MTIENSTNKMLPQQMGITVNYPFTFNVILQDPTEEEAKKAIKATVLQKDGTEIELVYNTDYTIVLNTNRIGGTLTVKNMRTTDDKIVIYRQYKQTQEADYKDFNASPAETLEQCFDKLTMLSQQQQEEINRSLKLNVSSTKTDLSLPEPVANNTLIWDKQGENLLNYDIIGENNKFKAEINAGLEAGLSDIQNQFDNMKAEQNEKFETFETEINENIEQFKTEITTDLEDVLEASEKINQLEESVATATNASKVATEQATIAKQQASIATNKANEAINASTETKNQINTRANLDLSNLSTTGQAKFDAKADVTSVLNKTQITNCIVSVEELVKVATSSSSAMLTLKKGSIVYVSTNGTFNEVTIQSDVSAGSGGLFTDTGSRDLYACYVPSINEIRNIPVTQTYSQASAPSASSMLNSTYCGWFDTTNNIMKYTYDGGASWLACSLPFALGNPISGGTGWYQHIRQVFNGFGVVGQKTFATRGVTSLLPNGRNADGTLKNKEVTSTSFSIFDEAGKSSKVCFWDGTRILTYGVVNYFEQDEKPIFSGNNATWLNTKENVMYSTSDGGATWTPTGLRCYLGKLVKTNNGVITEFKPNEPVEFLKKGDIEKNLVEVKAYITETYSSGTSWYRIWSDGWIEQGGKISAGGANPSEVSVTFLKAFSNANYTMIASSYDSSGGTPIDATINSRTATSAKIRTSNVAGGWYACGN